MRRTLEVVCALCVVFMLCFIFDHGIVSYALFLITIHSFMQFGIQECGKLKDGKIKATLLQGAGLYIAKIQRPVFDKDAESKRKAINLITITSLNSYIMINEKIMREKN